VILSIVACLDAMSRSLATTVLRSELTISRSCGPSSWPGPWFDLSSPAGRRGASLRLVAPGLAVPFAQRTCRASRAFG
jgi:hypothetical protein